MLTWRLGVLTLWRDFRAGELRWLWLSVVLAVAALTSVGFLSDRLQRGLQREAGQLLGGDAVLVTDQPPSAHWADRAQNLGLQMVQTLSFPTMARAPDELGGQTRLVALKAVQPHYPLRGTLKAATAPAPDGSWRLEDAATAAAPAPGTVWVDPGVLSALDLRVGQTLWLGDASFAIAGVLLQEPDRGAGFLVFAPRVMMAEADLAATALVQPASRVTWRLAVVGADPAVVTFRQEVQQAVDAGTQGREDVTPRLRGARLETLDSGRPEMTQTLDRSRQFLNLVALLAAVLCALALGLAARSFAQRHLDVAALWRVMGLSQRQMVGVLSIEFVGVALVAGSLGVVLGLGVHAGLVHLLAGLIDVSLPAPSPRVAVLGLGAALSLVLGFGLPSLMQLSQVPPLRVLRRDLGDLKASTGWVIALGLVGVAVLMGLMSQNLLTGAMALGGVLVASAVLAGVAGLALWLLQRSLRRAPNSWLPAWWVIATRQMTAQPLRVVLQVVALGLGLLALGLLTLLRTDILDSWQRATPPDAPNRFVINIQPDQATTMQDQLRQAGVARYDWFPMVRGRLVAINNEAVDLNRWTDERAKRLLDREFNLSHATQPPAHNTVVQGAWTPNRPEEASVEVGLAKDLGLKLGDQLTFDVGGQTHTSTVTSLRKVDWGSMRVNFFVMFAADDIGPLATTYITAFRAPSGVAADRLDRDLLRHMPNLTVVDTSQTIANVQRVLGQVMRAVEALFVFALVAGLVVLGTTLALTQQERTRTLAIMRALGATSGTLRRLQWAELLGVGLLAGCVASLGAQVLAGVLAVRVFALPWQPNWWFVPLGAVLGALLAALAGWWMLRDLLKTPVVQTLRDST